MTKRRGGVINMECPSCHYIHAPTADAMKNFFNNKPTEWIGDEFFENMGYSGDFGLIVAKQCPKCKVIFIQVETGVFIFKGKEEE